MRAGKTTRGQNPLTLIVSVFVILALLGGAGAWFLLLRSTPEQAVKRFLAAAQAGNETAARAQMSAETLKLLDELQKSMSAFGPLAADMKLAARMAPATQLDATITVGKAKVEGNSASVPVRVKPRRGDAGRYAAFLNQPMRCVKEGGRWKLDFTGELKMARQVMQMMTSRGGMSQFIQAAARQYGTAASGGGGSALTLPNLAPGTGTPAGTAAPTGTSAVATGGSGQADSVAALVQAGVAAKKAHSYESAAAAFNQALALDPANVEAHWNLAWVLADQGRKAKAVEHFRRIPELTRDARMVSEAASAVARLQ